MADGEGLPTTIDQDAVSEIVLNYSESAQILFAAGSVVETLASAVGLAVATIERCDFAGVLLAAEEVPGSEVHTDAIVARVDALQYDSGEGPCLDAMNQRIIVYAADLDNDPRWPTFAPRAVQAGIRSVLALPVAANAELGALNLYARYPAFGVVDRAKGAILASLASLAFSVAQTHEDDERKVQNLMSALATRETIGEALGILMERERISSEQAFDVLRRASQHLNIKLREVARNLVETGEDPDTGP